MIKTATVPLRGVRTNALVVPINFVGIDLTSATVTAVVLQGWDNDPADPEISLTETPNGNGSGVVVGTVTTTSGVPTSPVTLTIGAADMAAIPDASEVGADVNWVWYLMIQTNGSDANTKQRYLEGAFYVGGSSSGTGGTGVVTATIVDSEITVAIDGVSFLAPILAAAEDYSDLARDWAAKESGEVDAADYPGKLSALQYAELAEAWAEGTEPGGPGTKSAEEWAGEAETAAAEVIEIAETFNADGLGGSEVVQVIADAPNALDLRQFDRFDVANNAFVTPAITRTSVEQRWLKTLVGWGHSGIEGSGASYSLETDPYIAQRLFLGQKNSLIGRLTARLGEDWEVYNRGIATQPAESIAARMGAVPIRLTVTSNSVPASGTANLTAIAPKPIDPGRTGVTIFGTIGGVNVRLTCATGSSTTVIAQAPGASDALAVPANSLFIPTTGGLENAINIFQIDRNGNDLDKMKYLTGRMAARVVGGRFLFMGTWNMQSQSETTGTAGYNATIAINDAYRLMFPANFFDMRAFLRGDFPYDGTIEPSAWDVSGLSPDSNDTADIAAGYMPRAFLAVGEAPSYSHLGDAGYDACAKYFVEYLFPKMGWL